MIQAVILGSQGDEYEDGSVLTADLMLETSHHLWKVGELLTD
jgi:hypothetical protein